MSTDKLPLKEAKNRLPAYQDFGVPIISAALRFHNFNPEKNVTLKQWEKRFAAALQTMLTFRAHPELMQNYTHANSVAQFHLIFHSATGNNTIPEIPITKSDRCLDR